MPKFLSDIHASGTSTDLAVDGNITGTGNLTLTHGSTPFIHLVDSTNDVDLKFRAANSYGYIELDNDNDAASSRLIIRVDGNTLHEYLPAGQIAHVDGTYTIRRTSATGQINLDLSTRKDHTGSGNFVAGDDVGRLNFKARDSVVTSDLTVGSIITEADNTFTATDKKARMKIQLHTGTGIENVLFLDSDKSATFYGQVKAPSFYDSDDTAYFIDPSSTSTSLNVAGNVASASLTVNSVDQHHEGKYTAAKYYASFDRTSSSDQYFKIITNGGSPKRIRLNITSNGDNTNTLDTYYISQSGYNMQTHIFRLPGSKYNTSKLVSVLSINPSAATQEVWIKLLGMSSGTGTTTITANVPVSTSSAILATATTTKPTLSTGDCELDITTTDRNNYTTMSSGGAKFGGDVTTSGNISANTLYGDGSNLTNISSTDSTKLPLAGGTMTGAINMGNFNISGVNALQFNDPGPSEGVTWTNTKIFESPDDLTTNTAGNLQITYSNTRRLTVNSTGIDVNGHIQLAQYGYVDFGSNSNNRLQLFNSLSGATLKQWGAGDLELYSVSNNITFRAAVSGLGSQHGLKVVGESIQTPILYDLDDTNYYLNPASTTISLDVAGRITRGSKTFGGGNGVYADSRLGIVNNGSLTSIVNASTYNDANYPDYGLVFIQGPSTSSYNVWSISPDGPAKGSDLNFIYQAQATNIHTQTPKFKLHGSTGNATFAGSVTWSGGSSANANTAYTYSQAGHVPLSGGTMTGDLVMQDEMINFAAGNPELPNFRGKRSNTALNDRDWDTEGAWSYTTFENNTTDKPRTGLHNGNGLLTFNTHSGDGTNNYMHQLAFCTSPGTLHHRNRSGGGWAGWNEIAQTGRALTGDLRATVYYDASSTTYYLDPASTSTSLNVAGGGTFQGAVTIDSDGATDNYYLNFSEGGSNRFTIYENGNNVYFNGWAGHTIFRPAMAGSGSFAVTQGNTQFDTSGNATFAGTIDSGAITSTGNIITGGFFQTASSSIIKKYVSSWNSGVQSHDVVYNGWKANTGDYTYLKAAGNSTSSHGIIVAADLGTYLGTTDLETGAITDSATAPLTNTWAYFKNATAYVKGDTTFAGGAVFNSSIQATSLVDKNNTVFYIDPAGPQAMSVKGSIVSYSPANSGSNLSGGNLQLKALYSRRYEMNSYENGMTVLTTENVSNYAQSGNRGITALVLGNTPAGAGAASSAKDIFNITRVNQAGYNPSTGLGSYSRILNLRGNGDLYLGFTNSVGSVYATKYYDKASTGYYLDPASTSTSLNVAGTAFFAGTGVSRFSGGLTISGSVDSGGTDMGYYQSAGTNIILKGDSNGRSGIFFESEKDGTNINDPSDYGFIQFHAYGYGNTSGESAAMVIGVSNDSADKLILQAPYNGGVMIGYKDSTSGTGLTLSEVIHSNASSYNNGNWDTAYGWGNHASGGYAASSHTHSISNITGLQTSLDSKAHLDHIRSLGTQAFTGTATTAGLISEMETDGAFDSYSSVFKTSWSYAGNFDLSDAGRFTETAGSSWLTWTDNSSDSARGNITALVIAPNTGGSANKAFIYNDQGSGYAPGWREIWTSASDGAGSGLDADLLDGQHGSHYLDYSNMGTIPTWNQNTTGSSASCTGTAVRSDAVTGSAFSAASGSPSSVLEYAQASGVTDTKIAPSSDWYNSIRMGHGNPYSYYSNTMAVKMTGTGVGTLYTQTISNNTAQGWNKHWHDNNDGAGSGLDADKLDGQEGSYYLAYGNLTGTPTIPTMPTDFVSKASGGTFGGTITSSNINTSIKYLGTSVSYDTDRTTKVTSGVALYGAYSGGSNSPHTYDFAAQFVGNSRGFELSAAWHSQTRLKIRTLRDCCQNWSSFYDIAIHGLNNQAGDLYASKYYDESNTGYYLDPASTSKTSINIIDGRLTIGQSGDAGSTYRLYSAAGGQVYLGGHTNSSSITMSGTLNVTGHYANVGNLNLSGIGNSPVDTGTGGGTGSGSNKLLGYDQLNGSGRASAVLGVNDQGIVMEYEKVYTFKVSGNGWVNRSSNPYKLLQAPGADKMIVVEDFVVYIDYETRTGIGNSGIAYNADTTAYSIGFFENETGQQNMTGANFAVSGSYHTLGTMPRDFVHNSTIDRGYYQDVPKAKSRLIPNRSIFFKTMRNCSSSGNAPGGAHYVKIKYRILDISEEFNAAGCNHIVDSSSYHGRYAHDVDLEKNYNDAGQAVS